MRPRGDGDGTSWVRGLGLFDTTMLVMGGIVGSGIFKNPAIVAARAPHEGAILGAWLLGGLAALVGAFVYAELARLKPEAGGPYAYLKDAFGGWVGFAFGWTTMTMVVSSAMAAVAFVFADHLHKLLGLALPAGLTAALTLGLLAVVNLLGVRSGAGVQSLLMVLKIGPILALVVAGFGAPLAAMPVEPLPWPGTFAFASAMVPVMFAFGGWATACYVAPEVRDAERTLPRALVLGVCGVIGLYFAVNAICLRTLGAAGLAASETPAADVIGLAWGPVGEKVLAAGIAVSTLGFLAQSMLTAPRLYQAMGADVRALAPLAKLDPRSGAPTAGILLQAALSIAIALTGTYGGILDYAIFGDFLFYGLTALAVFALRARDPLPAPCRIPLHPFSTLLFATIAFGVSIAAGIGAGWKSLVGLVIIAAGLGLYFLSRRDQRAG